MKNLNEALPQANFSLSATSRNDAFTGTSPSSRIIILSSLTTNTTPASRYKPFFPPPPHQTMATSAVDPVDPKLLSLPDDVLSLIFKKLTITNKYTLYSTKDAVNLAYSNERLRRIFSSQLTHITPLVVNRYAETLSSNHLEKLIRIAGENLRELHIPACYHSYVPLLPDICPNLEALHFVERSHISKELVPFDTDDEEDDDFDEDDIGEDDSDDDDSKDDLAEKQAEDVNEKGDNNNNSSDDHVNQEEGNEINNCENSTNGNNDNDAWKNDNGENIANGDYGNSSNDWVNSHHFDHYDESSARCPVVHILPRLNLRKLSVFRLSQKLCDSIIAKVAHRPIRELHLHRVRKYQLPLLIPLLSHPLQVLTVTISEWGYEPRGQRISKFIDDLIPAISRIPVVTFHSPGERELSPHIQTMVNLDTFTLPKRTALLIDSVRRNNSASKCCSINLLGENTFRLLSAVDQKASITLSSERITVRDDGKGTHITSLPLYEEFLQEDVTHLEKAYFMRRWDNEGEEILDDEWNPEWGIRLARRRLRLIRSYDASVLNTLNLSTEVLELSCSALPDVNDWGFLTGVRELYLLAPPTELEYDECPITVYALLEALPQLVDAFPGEFICLGSFKRPHCVHFPDRTTMIQNVTKTMDSIDGFARRGGDAATLSCYLEAILNNITI